MGNSLDFQNTFLDFLRGKSELINDLNMFYFKDPKNFINYVSEQRLENVFCKKIEEYGIDTNNIIFYKKIEEIKNKVYSDNLQKFKIGLEFIEYFRKNGINITPYKGFVYSFLAFGTPYERNLADLDFLLESPKDIYKIYDLTKNDKAFVLEYGKKITKESLYWDIKNNQEITIIFKNVIFEIHHAVRDKFYFFPRANYPWWNDSKKETISIEGKDIVIPKKELFLLEILCHNVYHEWSPLCMPFDMYYLLKNNKFDWDFIYKKANKLGITNILDEGLLYTYKITKYEPYPDFAKKPQKKIVIETVKKLEENNIYTKIIVERKVPLKTFANRFFQAVNEKETILDKFLMIMDYLFVPTRRNYEMLKLPKYLYFLYYLFNPIFMIFGRFRSTL